MTGLILYSEYFSHKTSVFLLSTRRFSARLTCDGVFLHRDAATLN